MHHGDIVSILPDKIRISEQELAPIGIGDGSICWGRWVPDRRAGAGQESFDHLVVSPFETGSWPVLFRVSLVLDDSRPGPLADVLEVLDGEDFNILTIDGTPAGHRHAVINIIGEAVAIRNDRRLLDVARRLDDPRRSFLDPDTQDYVHRRFAPRMLRYAQQLTRAVFDAHGKRPFLRESFVYGPKPRPDRGTMYDPASLPRPLRDIGRRQATEAVTVQWLQNHAFYWLYGRRDPLPRPLHFDAAQRALRPEGPWLQEFRAATAPLGPPFKAISSLNFLEQYIRLTLSPADQFGRTVRLLVPYTAHYDDRQSTKGLLSRLVSTISSNFIALRSVTMTTEAREANSEHGLFRILASVIGGVGNTDFRTEFARRAAEEGMAAARGLLQSQHCSLDEERVVAEPFGARSLFLSTNFNWLESDRRGLLDELRRIANDHGFILVFGKRELLPPEFAHRWNPNDSITSNVVRLMRSCDAFLQLIPASASAAQDQLIWLLFESGAAHSLRLPCAICLDTAGGLDVADWTKRLKAGTDKQVYEFSGTQTNERMLEAFEPAIKMLASQTRPDRSSRHHG